MWDLGSGLSRTLGLASSPAAPSVFIFLPLQLRFPGPSFERSSANIHSSLGCPSCGSAQLAAPQAWRNSSSLQPGGTLPHLHCREQSWGSLHWVIPTARRARRPAQPALSCPCPAGHLLSPLSTLQPPTKCLPILSSILLPSPNLLSGLVTHHLLHKDNRGQSSQHCICTPSPDPVAEAPSSFIGSFCQCPVDPEWPLICISVCAATFPSRFFSSASKKP